MGVFHHEREWVYAAKVKGTFQRVHRISGWALITGLFVTPWLRIGEHPVLAADIPARRFYLLGQVFTASDGFLMVLGALMAAFSLFLASAVLGRLWCGYVCPQTVFLEEWVRRVEGLFEGDASARRRRDAAGPSWDATLRKAGKVSTLTALAFALSMTVVSYFGGAAEVWTGSGSVTAYTMVAVLMGGILLDWLWFREQLCTYLCPYARFQSALTDDYSLVVAYDTAVPIIKGRKGVEAGACIDCKRCVQVCPAGIDIREGFQLDCINCARCVDACTDVLGKLERESLVTYSTIAIQEGRPQKTIRPRVLVYATLVTGLAATIVGMVALHNPMEVSVQRAPGTFYQLEADGRVRNTYLLKIVNNAQGEGRDFSVTVSGMPGAEIDTPTLFLKPEEARTVPLVIRAKRGGLGTTVPIQVLVEGGEKRALVKTTFKSPGGEG